jgi:hypothetical protein
MNPPSDIAPGATLSFEELMKAAAALLPLVEADADEAERLCR